MSKGVVVSSEEDSAESENDDEATTAANNTAEFRPSLNVFEDFLQEEIETIAENSALVTKIENITIGDDDYRVTDKPNINQPMMGNTAEEGIYILIAKRRVEKILT